VAHGRRIGCGSGWASARRSGGRRLDVEVTERVMFALVAQRALEPASKPAATRWVVERLVIDLQPRATTRTPTSSRARGTATPNEISALTVGAEDGTKARYAFVYGDFRRVHRMGLIACSYRAAEWRHKEIELTAVELLQYLDAKSERVRKR
jgi:hypothetical protein